MGGRTETARFGGEAGSRGFLAYQHLAFDWDFNKWCVLRDPLETCEPQI